MDDARYPIGAFDVGRFRAGSESTPAERKAQIGILEASAPNLREAIAGLSEEQLATPYREGGWTVRQVVHHVPDSHLNAYIRCKWALTEDAPVIKAYFEERWALLPDTERAPLEVSLTLLGALHERWVALWRALTEADFARTFVHPDSGPQSLTQTLAYYAWHSQHHTAHITSLRQRRG